MRYILTDVKAVRDLDLTPGDILEECHKCDYGMKSDHERITGEEHINLSHDGDYPFYTLPRHAVEVYTGQG